MYLLQYVAGDYGAAVRGGAVVNPFEYDEVVRFSAALVDACEQRFADRVSPETLDRLRELRDQVRGRRPWGDIRRLAGGLLPRLARELGVSRVPPRTPDLARGAAVYTADCAPCHGPRGGGDGWAARWLDPLPSSFRDERMKLVSPHQVYGATRFGIEGTGMPAWEGARADAELWDVAFHVLTLRFERDRSARDPGLGVGLADLAASSDEELLARLRAERRGVSSRDLHYYRLHPPPLAGEVARPRRGAEQAASAAVARPTDPDEELAPAVELQNVFGRIAEQTFPSIVGVRALRRARAASPPSEGSGPRWTERSADVSNDTEFEPVGEGSGFFVTRDGYILTCRHFLVDSRTGEVAERVEVEMEDDRREPARVVALEPTINLAVLKIEVPFDVTPARLGDGAGIQVGHWVIALANPPGVTRSFLPGTVSARPQRECYQEQRTGTLLQTSLLAPPDGFGGPLVNIRGEVIGIAMPREPGGGPLLDRSISPVYGFPIDLAMTLFEPLRIRESRRSPWIGISVLNLTTQVRRRLEQTPPTGLYIDDVFEPSPATRAGIRAGDILVRIGEDRMFAVQDFQKALYLAGIGTEVELELYRRGETLVLRVVIEQRPAEATTR